MIDLFRLGIHENGSVALIANMWIVLALAGIVVSMILVARWARDIAFRQQFEINEIELGVGSGKVKIKPNHDDLQIAYRLWVELKTRKLGLPFDEDHDVIADVYNSWYEFFKITRELIKAVPVAKIRSQRSTQVLVGISIDVLNKAIRPHLTRWQARYRHWIEVELRKQGGDVPPQDFQKRYPEYGKLVSDLKATNARLVAYANLLAEIVQLGSEVTREESLTDVHR